MLMYVLYYISVVAIKHVLIQSNRPASMNDETNREVIICNFHALSVSLGSENYFVASIPYILPKSHDWGDHSD